MSMTEGHNGVREVAAPALVFVTCGDAAEGCRTAAGRCSLTQCHGSHGMAGFPEGGALGGGCCTRCEPDDHCGCCAKFDVKALL